mmetsp:Transcript_62268/g.171074  ORF Transcript_62268/g.171074 Transcript_62268/m.171074 type:complete len:208 (+) Transcript_62268:192-815(+)
MLTTAARATATRRSPPVACPVRCQLLWAVPLTEPCALTTWKPAASKAAVASATCESGTSVKSVARPPPESVEHPRMEICDDASTDAIAATTPVSLRPASRMQIGIISSWWIPDSPAGDALQCSTHHGVSPATRARRRGAGGQVATCTWPNGYSHGHMAHGYMAHGTWLHRERERGGCRVHTSGRRREEGDSPSTTLGWDDAAAATRP